MMGERNPQKQLWSYQVNLDKRVCSDHPLRRINETLDLDFVRREVAKCYGTKGNVSEDPVVIMKMMLLLFLENVFYPIAVRHNKPGSPSSITAW